MARFSKRLMVMERLAELIGGGELRPGDRMPSLRDLAQAYGVSVTVIKAALETYRDQGVLRDNDGSGYCLVDATPEKVQASRRDVKLSSMAIPAATNGASNFNSVLFICAESSPAFYGEFLTGALNTLKRNMFHMLLSLTDFSVSRESEEIQLALATRVAKGLIIVPSVFALKPAYFEDLRLSGLPFVFIGDVSFDEALGYDNVACDNVHGVNLIMDALFERGHSKIAYLEHLQVIGASNMVRHRAYQQRMTEAGYAPYPELTLRDRDRDDYVNADKLRDYLERCQEPPTAFLCFNDNYALACVRALRLLGLSVPDDVSVCGFDDREMVNRCDPPLATVHYPRYEIASKAAETLLAKISGDIPLDEFQRVLIKPTFVARESMGKAKK